MRWRRLCEAMAGKIQRDDHEALRENGRKLPPGMGRRPRAVQQQQGRPRTHPLHMPTDSGRLHEGAGVAVGPVATIPAPDEIGHDARPLRR